MSSVEYAEARERWTLKNQVMDDNETKILSPLRVQTHDACSYFALAATLEPNLRVQCKRNISLSTLHLSKLLEDSKTRLPHERGIRRLLLMVQNEGVYEEKQYEEIIKHKLREKDARNYKIVKFRAYDVNNPDDIRQALYQLRRGGPLLAVIRISKNYHKCFEAGFIYRFDPSRNVKIDNVPSTHAVCVVSFGIESGTPFLECQDSRGPGFSRRGFLPVDITSVKELYSIRIRRSR